MAPTTAQKLLAAYNGFYGVTLYHNWVTYYGPKGIMPYFLKTEGPVALMAWRMLGCLLLGITYGLLTAGPKDKTALKIATVGQAMMLPLMAMAGFGTDAATYAQTMWKTQLVVHAGDDLRWVFRESTDEDEIVEQKTIRKTTRTTTRGVASYVEGRERKCASRPE